MGKVAEKLSVKEVQAICLRNYIPFYTYRLPGSNEVVFGAQLSDEMNIFNGFAKHHQGKGFVMTPFSSASWSFPFFIRADISFSNFLENDHDIMTLRNTVFNTPERHFVKTDCERQEYLDKVRSLIEIMQREQLKKIVLSRTISLPCDSLLIAPHLFEKLQQYDHAFLFFVAIPGKCAWMGATPETFLKYDREGFHTMSLAATQPADSQKDHIEWTPKAIEEQQIVTDYIQSILQAIFKEDLDISPTETIRAGNVFHLCTRFNSKEQLPSEEIDELIRQLHPTPAVCGLPQKRAMQIIHEIEEEDRKYYTGFLGPVKESGAFHLFVNLRSMELFNDAIKLYVGGGITPSSIPEEEWQETCNKADTLLTIIQQIHHGKPTF